METLKSALEYFDMPQNELPENLKATIFGMPPSDRMSGQSIFDIIEAWVKEGSGRVLSPDEITLWASA